MRAIRRTDVFDKWFKEFNDRTGKALIYKRIERLAKGSPGDSAPIGGGLSEMRVHYGPGYRVYYKDTGKEIVVLLCGGDKSTQSKDIKKAKKLAKEI